MEKHSNESIFIRKLRLSDSKSIHEHVNDKQIAKWTLRIPFPYKEKYARNFIKECNQSSKARTGFTFGIILKETNSLIGVVGFHAVCLEDKNAEVGYWVSRQYWKKGVATEAVKLALKFGFKKLRLKRIYAKVFKGNSASVKVLQKNGFKTEGLLRKSRYKNKKWLDEIVLSKLNEDSE